MADKTKCWQDLVRKIRNFNPQADLSLVEKAYQKAAAAHAGQVRQSGEPYISHPLAVAYILAQLELDLVTIAAALLHDVVEDTEVTLEEIRQEFGDEVALLVDGVTKLSRIEYRSKEEQQAENWRKMLLAMARDIRVILIKLADRLHNMRTLKFQSPRKQKEIAAETLDIYAPLANRLGIFRIKWELEDLSLRYLEPEMYYELVERIAKKRTEREALINQVIKELSERLAAVGIGAEISGRPKHFYSIYKKMWQQQKDLSEIYDLIAVRVIVDNVKDCYGTLGIVHTLWTPVPGRFKDYIAMPKQNMYQSLHTTVIGPNGEPLEVQIRTWEMHRTAEYGIAAHWRYKEGIKEPGELDEKLTWLRQILEWQRELGDAKEFIENLKIDLFDESVFVFTPKGDVIELPAGSIPIDFAYRIHTDVGHRCVGAKVNGKIVPLDYKLKNGDIVEIITSRQAAPSRDWLQLVQTPQAKNRIKQWFKREKREENILRGRELLEKEARKAGLELEDIKQERIQEICRKFTVSSPEDLLAAVGDGTFTAVQVLNKIKELKEEREKAQRPKTAASELQEAQDVVRPWKGGGRANQGIMVLGMDNLLVRLARCCSPVPGDPIVGYVTRGKGVSVHRADCHNVVNFQETEKERIIEVTWEQGYTDNYQVKLEIAAMDRAGLLSDVMAVLSDLKISANSVSARSLRNNQAAIELVLEVKGLEQLNYIINRIRKVRDVYEIRRTAPGA
ncbi:MULTISPECIES: bifunctional (p)ppGpp synthetase/guanosine-3',5'-bis(diphosphate) 3'-pyrophosphohydrolase [unclassified Carboxydocella]|uniref:RelA/SpoT family protein n=1 Tax=unclassified Carboxydocella TaxID=2685367 RepID=UPI0009AE10AA|nr:MULTISPECIES: bifunctional (p)ppGpp synthetase/guanosine-3',5'-bis(diphosphate) 3'-pyrophosphohydrolase [unclassified Carboxydocella]GAW29204.1 (p)ppGpp synthetase [Carboxydocella sp. ULO1]GAW32591.1 (p)ppGpp synthetase [Carboxydocella sp. JDF658]